MAAGAATTFQKVPCPSAASPPRSTGTVSAVRRVREPPAQGPPRGARVTSARLGPACQGRGQGGGACEGNAASPAGLPPLLPGLALGGGGEMKPNGAKQRRGARRCRQERHDKPPASRAAAPSCRRLHSAAWRRPAGRPRPPEGRRCCRRRRDKNAIDVSEAAAGGGGRGEGRPGATAPGPQRCRPPRGEREEGPEPPAPLSRKGRGAGPGGGGATRRVTPFKVIPPTHTHRPPLPAPAPEG